MKFRTRFAIIAVWPLLAVGVILAGMSSMSLVPVSVGEPAITAVRWLGIVAVLYVANHIAAWRYAKSWSIFVTRALIWAVIAYICISSIVDLFGMNWEISNQILGLEGGGDPQFLSSIRLQLGAQVIMLVMAIVCIGFGFESIGEEN
jgi:fucose 4-O-acetylase-like acetyltransferase